MVKEIETVRLRQMPKEQHKRAEESVSSDGQSDSQAGGAGMKCWE